MTTEEKFKSLNPKSAWSYTKQIANYNELFLSSKLFDEIPDRKHTNVEQYFLANFKKYGIATNRHRILAIAQMFGLITKERYFSRGSSSYSEEEVTPIFELLKTADSDGFKKIMSEQLIKLRIKAITDTTSYRDNYYVYPFLFLFLVMWKLDADYGVKLVPMNKIWTYVLTCNSMDDVNDAVCWLMDPKAKVSEHVAQYKSDSRLMTLIFDNTKMFSLEDDMLSLNHPIAENFYNEFVLEHDLTIMQSYLYNDAKYKDFLENLQGFDFDLSDNVTGVVRRAHKKRAVFKSVSEIEGAATLKGVSVIVPEKSTEDVNDLIDVFLDMEDEQSIKDASVYTSEEEIEMSNNRTPVLKSGLETNKRYSTDSRLAKTAIKNAGYVCELYSHVSGSHTTFDSANGNKYLEAHHLIPMKAQKDFVSLGINLDRLENIVALCPNCHKAVHYGTKAEKVKYLRPLYDARIAKLKKLGIDIDFDVLIDDYYK